MIPRLRARNPLKPRRSERPVQLSRESAMRIRDLVLHSATVTFSSKSKIKVTLGSRSPAAPLTFPSTAFRYADKLLKSRTFFCALKQGNSRTRFRSASASIECYGHAAALSRNVREVSGATKMYLGKFAGRNTGSMKGLVPLSRVARHQRKEKNRRVVRSTRRV